MLTYEKIKSQALKGILFKENKNQDHHESLYDVEQIDSMYLQEKRNIARTSLSNNKDFVQEDSL